MLELSSESWCYLLLTDDSASECSCWYYGAAFKTAVDLKCSEHKNILLFESKGVYSSVW